MHCVIFIYIYILYFFPWHGIIFIFSEILISNLPFKNAQPDFRLFSITSSLKYNIKWMKSLHGLRIKLQVVTWYIEQKCLCEQMKSRCILVVCNIKDDENITHILHDCEIIKPSWEKVSSFWNLILLTKLLSLNRFYYQTRGPWATLLHWTTVSFIVLY